MWPVPYSPTVHMGYGGGAAYPPLPPQERIAIRKEQMQSLQRANELELQAIKEKKENELVDLVESLQAEFSWILDGTEIALSMRDEYGSRLRSDQREFLDKLHGACMLYSTDIKGEFQKLKDKCKLS